MVDVITPKFGGGGGNSGGGGNGPSYTELLIAIAERNKIILHQQQLLDEAKSKLAAQKAANQMLQLTLMDLIRTLNVNQGNIQGTIKNLEEILKKLPTI